MGFASHDVAGILYNAMVLHDGGLPYVDTVELKAPGTFWLAKWFAGAEGRDIGTFMYAATAWSLTSMLAVAGLAWRTFGARAACVAVLVYGLHDSVLDSMDANYVTWANLPQILAFVAGALAATIRTEGGSAWWNQAVVPPEVRIFVDGLDTLEGQTLKDLFPYWVRSWDSGSGR